MIISKAGGRLFSGLYKVEILSAGMMFEDRESLSQLQESV